MATDKGSKLTRERVVSAEQKQHIVTQKLHHPHEGGDDDEFTVNEVYVSVGEQVRTGDQIANIETPNKGTIDVEASKSGVVVQVHVQVGDTVTPTMALLDINTASEATPKVAQAGPPKESAPRPAMDTQKGKPRVKIKAGSAPSSALSGGRSAKAMPVVRNRAQELGFDIDKIKGSGADGVVMLCDVENASQGSDEIPLLGARKMMFEHMERAREAVRGTVTEEVDISELPKKTSIIARTVQAIVTACKEAPSLNAWFDPERCTRILHDHVHIGIAIDVPKGRRGESDLFVPVLGHAEDRTQDEIIGAINAMKRAVKKDVAYRDTHGTRKPTISLSNFGTIGGIHAELVVVPPQVAILGVGRVQNGRILPLSLSFDHRAVTGGEAIRFLSAVRRGLEDRVSL